MWYIKTSKNSDDVFIWESTTATQYKVSLHNGPTVVPGTTSRPWRLAMTREYADSQGRPREVLWQGIPAPFIQGAILGPGVSIPYTYLKTPAQEPAPRFVRYRLPTSNGTGSVVFRLVLAATDFELDAALDPYQSFARLRRSSGGWVGVGTVERTMTPSAMEACESMVVAAKASAAEQEQPTDGRIIGVFSPDGTGIPLLVDLASD